MDYFKGTYSFFRYPNDRLVGFSPFLGYLNVKSGFLRKAFDMKRENPVTNIELLVKEIFHSVQGNLTATINPRKPIYIIAKSGLLNEFIVHVMMNNIEGFEKNHKDELIENQNLIYTEFLKCECFKNKTEKKCKDNKTCLWIESIDGEFGCQLKNTTSEIKKNKKKFTKNIREFFELINNCMYSLDRNNILTPQYLLGLTLMSYWYLIKNMIYQGSEKDYFDDYMQTINLYIGNSSNDPDIDKIDEFITKNNFIQLPKPLSMIHAIFDNINYPACFETVLNEFFNLLFYNENSVFIPKIDGFEVLPSLVDHYNFINENNSDYTSHFIINKFVSLTTHIPGINYNQDGYNIMSNYDNFLTILNYFLNTNYENLKELLEEIGVFINEFNEENGVMDLDIKQNNIILNISPGHSFSKRKNKEINFENLKDKFFELFYKFLSFYHAYEIVVNYTFIDLYNTLNKNIFSLPFYKCTISSEKDIEKTKNIISKELIIKNIESLPNGLLFIENLEISMPDSKLLIKNIKVLDLSDNELKSLPKEIIFPENLQELYLNNNGLVSLPENIIFPKNLRELYLNNNKLKSLPDNIIFPESLQVLHLNFNELSSLPEKIKFPESLKILRLNHNELSSLPKNIIFPESLEELYLNHNKLSLLPENIIFPKNLQELRLSNNKLKSLPEKIIFPKSLQVLYLDDNDLVLLPEKIIFPESLQVLYLFKNKLKSLPENIIFPKSLQELYLNNNELSSLPEKLIIPESLQTINLNNNRLKSLPENIIFPKSLHELYLNNNELSSLPENINFPKNIQKLELNNNELSSLPENIIFPKNIQKLYLNNNKLSSLPEKIIFPESLKELYLNNNELSSLSEKIIFPNSLEFLNLSYNNLKSIPYEFKYNCYNLKKLYLNNNELNSFPTGIPKNLKELFLHNNKLEFIPNIFPCIYLKVLYLHNNNISSLPEGVSFPNGLNILSLNNNNLSSLPENIKFPEYLLKLYLHNNKLESLPENMIFKHILELYLHNNNLFSLPKYIDFRGDIYKTLTLTLYGNKKGIQNHMYYFPKNIRIKKR